MLSLTRGPRAADIAKVPLLLYPFVWPAALPMSPTVVIVSFPAVPLAVKSRYAPLVLTGTRRPNCRQSTGEIDTRSRL